MHIGCLLLLPIKMYCRSTKVLSGPVGPGFVEVKKDL